LEYYKSMATAKKSKVIATNTVIIYCRISTDKQERSGLGLEAQLNFCRQVAEQLNIEIIGEFQETISGKVNPKERPTFCQCVTLAQVNGSRIMVAKLDRFSREVYHVAGYTQKYLWGQETPELIVAESPRMSQLELYIKAMLAEEERKQIGERTRAALAVKKAQGYQLGKAGRTAYVSKARGSTEEAIALAKQLRGEGLSYSKIADKLNELGVTTSKGGQWYAANIRERLINIDVE
jgi:DNA invertase Pin-like site-specific DNA recombinase